MKAAALAVALALAFALFTLLAVRFVPGAAAYTGRGSHDLYSDGHCEYSPGTLEGLSWRVFGLPPERRPAWSAPFTAQVVDEQARPLSGVAVALESVTDFEVRTLSATTNEAGVARLQLERPYDTGEAQLTAKTAGYADLRQRLPMPAIVTRLVLRRPLEFRGRLVDEAGEALPGVGLLLNGGGYTTTEIDGAFTLTAPAPGKIWLQVHRPEREEDAVRYDGQHVVLPQAAGDVAVITALRSGGKARIGVGSGAERGAWVRLAREDGPAATVVDAAWRDDSTFVFTGLEPGRWWVYFHQANEQNDVMHRTSLSVSDRETAHLELPHDAAPFAFAAKQ